MEYFQMKVRVGAFLLVALTLILMAAVTMSDIGSWFTPKHTYTVLLRNASLLPQGARVSYAGFHIGQVTAITIRSEEERARAHSAYPVALTLTVHATTPVRDDSVVEMQTDGMIGDRYIDIHPGSGAPLPPGSTILGTVGGIGGLLASFTGADGLQGLITATTSLLTDTSQPHSLPVTLANANQVLTDLQTHFAALASTGNVLLEHLQGEVARVGGKADQMFTNADATIQENRAGLREVVTKLHQTLADVQQTMAATSALVGDSKDGLAHVLRDTRQFLQDIQRNRATLTTQAEKLLADMDALLVHNDRNVYVAIQDLRATMARLKDAAELLRANPAVLFWGTGKSGSAETVHTSDKHAPALQENGRIGRYDKVR